MEGIVLCRDYVNVYFSNYWLDLRTSVGVSRSINNPGL